MILAGDMTLAEREELIQTMKEIADTSPEDLIGKAEVAATPENMRLLDELSVKFVKTLEDNALRREAQGLDPYSEEVQVAQTATQLLEQKDVQQSLEEFMSSPEPKQSKRKVFRKPRRISELKKEQREREKGIEEKVRAQERKKRWKKSLQKREYQKPQRRSEPLRTTRFKEDDPSPEREWSSSEHPPRRSPSRRREVPEEYSRDASTSARQRD